jgi:hypothetical protein
LECTPSFAVIRISMPAMKRAERAHGLLVDERLTEYARRDILRTVAIRKRGRCAATPAPRSQGVISAASLREPTQTHQGGKHLAATCCTNATGKRAELFPSPDALRFFDVRTAREGGTGLIIRQFGGKQEAQTPRAVAPYFVALAISIPRGETVVRLRPSSYVPSEEVVPEPPDHCTVQQAARTRERSPRIPHQ